MKQLVLIDGNSLLFRAYFAMRPMVTSSGQHTQGVFAFINMLNVIIKECKPDYMAVAFDMKGPTFRHERYSEYKAGRLATPIELLSEIPLTHRVLEAMNIAVLEKQGFEADDIIGTLAKAGSAQGLKTTVISGDKDELQLIDENVNVLINRKGMSQFDLYDLAAMKDRYNLTPTQFIDLKGLMGDKSDNIPGIPGIGEKKGIALLEKYGSLESVVEHAAEIPGKMGESIREYADQAVLSKWLATINTEAPIEFNWDNLKYAMPDYKRLVEVYTELEFSSFISKLNIPDDTSEEAAANNFNDYILSKSEATDITAFFKAVPDGSEVIVEAITDNNHLDKPDLTALLLYSESENIYIYQDITPINADFILASIAEKAYKLVGFGLKRIIYSFLAWHEAEYIPGYDIEIAEYLLDANRSKYLLSKMLLRYNSVNVSEEDISLHENDGSAALRQVSSEILLKRAYYISIIRNVQEKSLIEKGLDKLFRECEMPLVMTLADMELCGITVDAAVLALIGEEITGRVTELETEIYEKAGHSFNINSPKQLGAVLFDELKLPYPKGKASGGYSTAADILDKLKYDYPIISEILEFRKLSKLNSTYVEGLSTLIGSDGKIHPHFQQTVAATGRLSCTEPNLQNIPIRDDYGRLIRKAFITSKDGSIFTGSDYSQIELRVLAALSGDEKLIDAFREGKDIHRATASNVFNIPFDEVTSRDRSRAKAVNFGVVYGMSGFGLSENLEISRGEAQKYINDYFEKHTAVKQYLDEQIAEGEKNHEIKTYFGRIRQIPEFTSRKYMDREAAKRLAMNTPIQGTAADIIKYAMNSVRSELIGQGLKSKLILQIHDELIIEGPADEAEQVRFLLEKCMRGAASLTVELECETGSGKTWYDLK